MHSSSDALTQSDRSVKTKNRYWHAHGRGGRKWGLDVYPKHAGWQDRKLQQQEAKGSHCWRTKFPQASQFHQMAGCCDYLSTRQSFTCLLACNDDSMLVRPTLILWKFGFSPQALLSLLFRGFQFLTILHEHVGDALRQTLLNPTKAELVLHCCWAVTVAPRVELGLTTNIKHRAKIFIMSWTRGQLHLEFSLLEVLTKFNQSSASAMRWCQAELCLMLGEDVNFYDTVLCS